MAVILPLVMKLPYAMSANEYWRPVPLRGKAAGRSMIVPTEAAKAFKEDIGWRVKAYGVKAPLTCRITITLQLYPERPADWAKRAARDPLRWDDTVRCIDIDNARKVFFDAFNEVLWVDDKQVFKDSGERMEPDAEGARTLITVSEYVREPNPQLQLLPQTALAAR